MPPRAAPPPAPTPSTCSAPLAGPELRDDQAGALAEAFQALADPVRLRILHLLLAAESGQVCARDLVGPSGKSQPTVSHHLKVLRRAGLVSGERRGTWVHYSVVPKRLSELRAVLRTLPSA